MPSSPVTSRFASLECPAGSPNWTSHAAQVGAGHSGPWTCMRHIQKFTMLQKFTMVGEAVLMSCTDAIKLSSSLWQITEL